jgi:hypothetical protein
MKLTINTSEKGGKGINKSRWKIQYLTSYLKTTLHTAFLKQTTQAFASDCMGSLRMADVLNCSFL